MVQNGGLQCNVPGGSATQFSKGHQKFNFTVTALIFGTVVVLTD